MTAVPGAPGPRRLLLSSSAERGKGGLPPAPALIVVRTARVGLARVALWRMATLGVRAWQLLGAKRGRQQLHHRDANPPLPVRLIHSNCPRSRRILANPVPDARIRLRNRGSIADNSRQIQWKFVESVSQSFKTPPPSIRTTTDSPFPDWEAPPCYLFAFSRIARAA